MQDDDDDDPPIPFADDEEEYGAAQQYGRHSSLRLSSSHEMSTSNEDSRVIGGLDDSNDNQEGQTANAKKRKRRSSVVDNNKKRKIKADHGKELLSNKFMKQLFLNNDNVVLTNVVLPSTYYPDQQEMSSADRQQAELIERLGYFRLFLRPGIADNGDVAKPIIDLYKLTSAPVLGKPITLPMMETDETVEEAEVARQAKDTEGEDDEQRYRMDDDDTQFPVQDDDDFPPTNDDGDEAHNPFNDDDEHGWVPKDDSGFEADNSGALDSKLSASCFSVLYMVVYLPLALFEQRPAWCESELSRVWSFVRLGE